MFSTIFSFLLDSMLNGHTYVGIFLGAVFSKLWIAIYNYLKALIIKVDPAAATVINDVTTVTGEVVDVVTPVADQVITDVTPPKAS